MNRMSQTRTLFTTIWLCLTAFCHAADPASAPERRSQPARWLLILDTSAAMEKRAKAVEGIAAELLGSAMNGQMQAGDELGVWNYNKQLYAGVVPMQMWEPARSNLITGRTIEFLSRQVYRDTGRIENVLPELIGVARDSRQLTVVWFSDGSQKFAGTPFDDELNAAQAKLRASIEQTSKPIVTVLRGFHGKLVTQSVSLAPQPVEFPSFTNTFAKPVVVTPKRVPNTNNMIIMGPAKKTNTLPVAPTAINDTGVKLRPLPGEPSIDPANGITTSASQPAIQTPTVPAPEPAPMATLTPVQPEPVQVPPPVARETKPVELAANVPPASAAPTPIVNREPVAPATVATATGGFWSHKWPLIAGIGFMWTAVIVALVLARRARRANATSLITRAFGPDRK